MTEKYLLWVKEVVMQEYAGSWKAFIEAAKNPTEGW